jgi:hypothetical protein
MNNPERVAFSAYYDADSDMFVVEFLDEATFGPPLEGYRWSMFTHGVCADTRGGEFTFTPTWRYLGITGWHVYENTLAEDLNYRIDKAVWAMEHMYTHVKGGDELASSRRRCEAAARMLSVHGNAIVAELIASRGRARMGR